MTWAPSGYTWAWAAVGVAALVIEGVALFNSRAGDTLSEHVWAWLGVRTAKFTTPGEPGAGRVVTPKWTLRVARFSLVTFLVWLLLHFTTGGWV